MQTDRKIIVAVTIGLAAVISGCGGPEEQDAPADISIPETVDTLTIAVTDTIGLEMGDSCYVFGMLMEVAHGPSGEIIALDMNKACLSIYSPEGEYLGNIGAPGPGPGEFHTPLNFAVMSDGGVAVADVIGRNISFFDSERTFRGIMDGFFPAPPMNIEGSPDGGFIGESMSMIMVGEEADASMQFCKFADSTEAEVVYFSVPLEMNFDGNQAEAHRGPQYDFAVGPDGSVFIAQVSDTLFEVKGYTPEGEEFLTISEEMERTPLTQEEIDAGSLAFGIMISDGEASSMMERVENTDQYRNVIGSIGVDAEERIWVELTNTDTPVFRVFDYSGNLLFAAVPDVEFTAVTRPTFRVDAGGILAYDRDPMDYPKIFNFRLLEN
jgi:hypothetical protein